MKNWWNIVIFGFILLPLAAGLDLGGFEPNLLIQEPWFVFASVFFLFFAFIYAVFHQRFKKNLGAAIIISLIIAFIATAGVVGNDFIPGMGILQAFMVAALGGVGLFLIVSFAKAAYFNMGLGGVFIVVGMFISIFYWVPQMSGNVNIPDWVIGLAPGALVLGIPLIIIGLILTVMSAGREY